MTSIWCFCDVCKKVNFYVMVWSVYLKIILLFMAIQKLLFKMQHKVLKLSHIRDVLKLLSVDAEHYTRLASRVVD